MLGVEDDGLGAQQVRREDPAHVAPDAGGDVGGDDIDGWSDLAASSGGGDLDEVEGQAEASEQAGPLAEGALQARGGVWHGGHDAGERVDVLPRGVGVGVQGDDYGVGLCLCGLVGARPARGRCPDSIEGVAIWRLILAGALGGGTSSIMRWSSPSSTAWWRCVGLARAGCRRAGRRTSCSLRTIRGLFGRS